MSKLYASSPSIHTCVSELFAGNVIAYPTEAVWGLGCDPFDEHAVNKVLSLKNRKAEKGVILVAGNIDQFYFLLKDLDWSLRERLFATWPGPNTWLVEHKNRVPSWISGNHNSVALRVSKHPVIQALCAKFGGPIVSTSANPQGLPSAINSTKVRKYFKHHAYMPTISQGVVSGLTKPSTIRYLVTGNVLRG